MTDERWPSVDRVLQAALDRPPEEREAFVRAECAGDVVLRDEVLSLLAHTASAGGFLEAPSAERAPLSPGKRLGGYEVRQRIGSGGMGDVYRATDAKLHRDIALKVLPSDASDADRRDRFAREARAIAALNHPGIVTIHSVEEDDGVHFLTMELVEGRTLAEAISPGGLPLPRLLDIAIPLADAIGAAHGRGIVHRDIKPANVMVTREGRIKVLDFGLAKLRTPDALSAEPTTLEHGPVTREGSIVGTCAYMSPEQAEGREVDHRTDVFSLGVLIYELATGVRPFKGDSAIAVLSAIVKDTPVPVANLRPDFPAGLSRIISRCLAKDPGRRYQSVLDLRNDLEELQQGPIAAAPPVGQGTRWRNILLIAAAVILAAVAGYVLWPTADTGKAAADFQRLFIQPPSGVRIRAQEGKGAPHLAISPDGRWIAFTGDGGSEGSGLYLHLTSELESLRIRDESSGSPFFSSDSKWLGFWSSDKLWKVSVAGGEPEPICEVKGELRGGSWGDDNSIVYASGGNLFRVSSQGPATPEQLTHPGVDDPGFRFPHVLPGSKSVLVRLTGVEAELAVVSLPGGEVIHRLSPDGQHNLLGSSPQYVEVNGGWLVFRRSTRLYAAPFDLGRLNVTGDARPVFDGVSFNEGGSDTSAFAVSRSGVLLYIPPQERVEAAQLTWLNRHGDEEPVVTKLQDYGWPALDPKGERIAVHIAKSYDSDLSIYDLRTKSWRQVTHGRATRSAMAWTGNGKWIVFSSAPSGIPLLFRVLADDGEPEPLTVKAEYGEFRSAYDVATSTHGNVASFFRQVGPADFDLLTVSVDPPGQATPFLKKDVRTYGGQFSPDGRWIAYVSQEKTNAEEQVVLRSFPDAAQPVPIGPGRDPRWSADGQLYFLRGRTVLSVSFVPGRPVGTPQPVVNLPERTDLGRGAYDVAPDGKRFLIVTRPKPARTERLLVYVSNWMATASAAYAQSK